MHAQWKLKIVILQPTARCLELLNRATGNHIATQLTYVEIACDLNANSAEQALRWRNDLMSKARMKSQRGTVVLEECGTTFYFGSRNNRKKLRANVQAVYADKPSKLKNARPVENDRPCLHIENRTSGATALAAHGIVSLSDLIQFDHQRFWNEHLIVYALPGVTKLGRILAEHFNTDISISDTALVKKAHVWRKRYQIRDKFIMHNAIVANRGIEKYFDRVKFIDWVNTLDH